MLDLYAEIQVTNDNRRHVAPVKVFFVTENRIDIKITYLFAPQKSTNSAWVANSFTLLTMIGNR